MDSIHLMLVSNDTDSARVGHICSVISGSVSSRPQQPTRFHLLLDKLQELSIQAKVYSMNR